MDIADQINATKGSVSDKLQQALREAEEEDWLAVVIIGLKGDTGTCRLVGGDDTGMLLLGMSAWNYHAAVAENVAATEPREDDE